MQSTEASPLGHQENYPHRPDTIISDNVRVIVQIVGSIALCGPISLAGLIGNGFNLIVFYRQGPFADCSTLNFFALAVADTGCLLTVFLVSVLDAKMLTQPHDHPTRFMYAKVLISWAHMTTVHVVSWLTAFITFHRCICVVFPFKARTLFSVKNTLVTVVIIAVVVPMTFIPAFYSNQLTKVYDRNTNSTVLAIEIDIDMIKISTFTNSFLLRSIVLLVVFVCNKIIIYKVKLSKSWRESMATGTGSTRNAHPRTGDAGHGFGPPTSKLTNNRIVSRLISVKKEIPIHVNILKSNSKCTRPNLLPGSLPTTNVIGERSSTDGDSNSKSVGTVGTEVSDAGSSAEHQHSSRLISDLNSDTSTAVDPHESQVNFGSRSDEACDSHIALMMSDDNYEGREIAPPVESKHERGVEVEAKKESVSNRDQSMKMTTSSVESLPCIEQEERRVCRSVLSAADVAVNVATAVTITRLPSPLSSTSSSSTPSPSSEVTSKTTAEEEQQEEVLKTPLPEISKSKATQRSNIRKPSTLILEPLETKSLPGNGTKMASSSTSLMEKKADLQTIIPPLAHAPLKPEALTTSTTSKTTTRSSKAESTPAPTETKQLSTGKGETYTTAATKFTTEIDVGDLPSSPSSPSTPTTSQDAPTTQTNNENERPCSSTSTDRLLPESKPKPSQSKTAWEQTPTEQIRRTRSPSNLSPSAPTANTPKISTVTTPQAETSETTSTMKSEATRTATSVNQTPSAEEQTQIIQQPETSPTSSADRTVSTSTVNTPTTPAFKGNPKPQTSIVRQNQLIMMISIISSIFLICNFPDLLVMMILMTIPAFKDILPTDNLFPILMAIQFSLECFNSSLNIIVYYKMSSNYRRQLRDLMRKRPD